MLSLPGVAPSLPFWSGTDAEQRTQLMAYIPALGPKLPSLPPIMASKLLKRLGQHKGLAVSAAAPAASRPVEDEPPAKRASRGSTPDNNITRNKDLTDQQVADKLKVCRGLGY